MNLFAETMFKIVVSALLEPKHIIHNWKTDETIVIWPDGDKTVVKPTTDAERSPYSAFTAALAKRVYGSNTQVTKRVMMTEEPEPKKPKKITSESDIIKVSATDIMNGTLEKRMEQAWDSAMETLRQIAAEEKEGG